MIEKQYDVVDLLKFIGSILILIMHVGALNSFNANIQLYTITLPARFGVPFFFIISSFLLFSKSEGNNNITTQQLKSYVKRIALLYLIYGIFNLPQIFYSHIFKGGIFNIYTWLLFFKNILTSSSYMGSWYMTSCIFSSCLIHILSKKFSSGVLIILTVPLYTICIFTSAYSGIFPEEELTAFFRYVFKPFNSIICGPFYFAVGKYIHDNRERFLTISKKTALSLTIVFFVLFYVEIITLSYVGLLGSTDSAFMLIPFAFFISIFSLNNPIHIPNARNLRKMSTIIYCGQGIIIAGAKFVAQYILKTEHTFIIFLITAIAMTVCILSVFFLQNKTKFKCARYLT